LVGTPLTDAPLATTSEGACRIACCGVTGCQGYAYAFTELRLSSAASCFLYADVTATVAASVMASGLHSSVPYPGAPSTTPTPTASPSHSPTPNCAPSLFRVLPRMDLVGSLVGTSQTPNMPILLPSADSCRRACCDTPACHGYSFAATELAISSLGSASCFLYVNITQLIPSSGYSSGIYESTL
jgi:hypothetical protein